MSLLAIGCGGTFRVLDVEAREYIDFPGIAEHAQIGVREVRLSPDGARLALCGGPRLTVIDLAMMQIEDDWPDFGSLQFRSLAWSPDGTKLAVAFASGGVRIIDVETKVVTPMQGYATTTFMRCVFSPDGTKVAATYTTTPRLRVWNVADGTEDTGWPTVNGTERGLAWSPNGDYLGVASSSGTTPFQWTIDTTTKLRDTGFTTQPNPSLDYEFSPDGSLIAIASTVSSIPRVYFLDVATKANITGYPTYVGTTDLGWQIRFSPSGERLWVCSYRGWQNRHSQLTTIDVVAKTLDTDWPDVSPDPGDPDMTANALSLEEFELPAKRIRRALTSEDIPSWEEQPVGSTLVVGAGGLLEWAPPAE